jgi:hypothetical protein
VTASDGSVNRDPGADTGHPVVHARAGLQTSERRLVLLDTERGTAQLTGQGIGLLQRERGPVVMHRVASSAQYRPQQASLVRCTRKLGTSSAGTLTTASGDYAERPTTPAAMGL